MNIRNIGYIYIRYHTYRETWHRVKVNAAFLNLIPARSPGINLYSDAQ